MSDMLLIDHPMHGNTIAQDALGTIFSTGVATLVSPLSTSRILEGDCRASIVMENFGRWKTVWTLPSLWTHRTRPQGTWKTADSFPQRPHRSFFLTEEKN